MQRLAGLLGAGLLAALGLAWAWAAGTAPYDAPVDPFAQQKAALAYADQVQSAALGANLRLFGALVLACLLIIALLGAACWVALALRGLARRQELVMPDNLGRWPLPYAALMAEPAVALETNWRIINVAKQAAIHQPGQMPTTYHNVYQPQLTSGGYAPDALEDAPPDPAVLELPGPCTFSDVLSKGFTPTQEAILLGIGPGGALITLPADEALCHILVAGTTGRGKSILLRLLLTQLLYAQVPVYWLDPFWADFDKKRRIDRRPFIRHLAGGGPITRVPDIARFLAYVTGPMLEQRIAAMQAGGDPGDPFFVFAEEWPQLIDQDKEHMAGPAQTFVRTYRQYGGYLGISSQGALAKTLGVASDVTAQFSTGYYVGGDETTAARVTARKGTIPEPPGKGIVYLRCEAQPRAELTRIPMLDNRALYDLLGYPDTPAPWDTRPRLLHPGVTIDATAGAVQPLASRAPEDGAAMIAATVGTPAPIAAILPDISLTPEQRRALELFDEGLELPAAIEQAYNVKRNNPGAYSPKYAAVQEALRLQRTK